MISALATHYDVVLVSLLPEEQIGAALPIIPDVWRQFALPLPVFRSRSLSALAGTASRYPRSIAATWSAPTARAITDLVNEFDIQAAIGADLRTLRYLRALTGQMPTVLDEPDVSPFVTLGGRKTLRARLRERKYQHLLDRSNSRLSSAIVASEQEASAYRFLAKSDNVIVIENGVGTLPSAVWKPVHSSELLYTGSLCYAPNSEAIVHFIGNIMPLIEGEFANVALTVTGQLPERLPEAIRRPRVHLTGSLDSLDYTFQQSRVFIAPLLSGTGTRIKLLEAMAHGMPIVTTAKGAEGLPVEDGKHLLIADSPAHFAAAVRRLMGDPDLSSRLGAAGRDLVADRFTWDSKGTQLRALIVQLLEANRNQESDVA